MWPLIKVLKFWLSELFRRPFLCLSVSQKTST
nr:MAG TPA: hypothetical protein [Caudoviricetes sp.]